MNKSGRIMVAISGASGMLYAKRLLNILPNEYDAIYLTASDNAINIMNDELGINNLEQIVPDDCKSSFVQLDANDISSPPASGSHEYDGLIIIPCSMGLVGRIASGVSADLVTRAADVCLKEQRKLVLVVREAPFNLIHLRNMTLLAEAGAVIIPAAPAFYNKPETISDLIDFIVDRVLRVIGSEQRLIKEWGK